MIRFEIIATKKEISCSDIDEVAIIMDSKGIDELCRSLERLKIMDSPNHLHLSIFGCCDINLDEHSSGIPNSTLIPQVRIVKVN